VRLVLAACAAVLVPAAVDAQTMYKCVLNGKTVYQGEACPEEAKQHTLQAPKAGPTRSAAAQAAEEAETGLEIVSGFRACSDGVAEWGATNKAGYDAWRAANAALVARIENDPALQQRYRQRMQATRYGTPEMCAKIAAMIRPEPTTSKAK
jgi:hypothetical protein